MIKGIGVDVIRVDRVGRTLERYGERFLKRIFTRHEREYCLKRKNVHQHLAARFGAKEAVYKALGAFVTTGIRWKEIEIYRERGSAPQVRLYGAMKEAAKRGEVERVLISITHEGNMCIVVAVAEG